MKILNSVTELVGNTPLVRLENYKKINGLSAQIVAKTEYLNPAGSTKDRAALNMILEAEKSGTLQPGGAIIEPTSGNTGIGLACIAAARGYRAMMVMPDTMSKERIALIGAYGAEIVLTEGAKGMNGAIEKAEQLHREIAGSILAGQFVNPANPAAHYATTGPEIWRDTDGQVDIFVAGIGSGGTISGIGRYLKEQNPNVRIVGVEPSNSAVLSGGTAGPHGLQGIGAGFVPENLDTTVYDEIIPVDEESAYTAGRFLAEHEGLLCGITSGAALHAAGILARRPENNGKMIVVLLPDSGDRYLSTPLFEK